ncbi:MAG: HD domain-containing protein [Clostridiales bacterium]|nr:HD domain-containing protein [Clostridiales bacterium]
MTRLEKQIQFIEEVDKLKTIVRQTYIADGSRKENDAEHSWHLALMCVVLSEYSNEDIDIAKTMAMLLLHDIIEIDAGDTYAYDAEANTSKKERELAAAQRIFNILPEDQAKYFRALWDEFEEAKTPEAKFANTLDKLQPVILNNKSKGKSWREHQVKASQIYERNKITPEGSESLWHYAKEVIKENIEKKNIIDK